MKEQKRRTTLPRQGRSLMDSVRQFLTPEVWKQGHRHCPRLRKHARWALQPLVLTLLLMTWCAGTSQEERFETAKAFCCVRLSKRRRPGQSMSGFRKALAKLPTAVLRSLAKGIRQRLVQVFGKALAVDGFVPLGVDGSRLECPRSAELEQRLPEAGKPDAAPTVWLTCLVHLGLGLLWAWRVGPGTASERAHLVAMLTTLPQAALIVGDAGFNGFFQAQAVLDAGASFLIRMSAKVTLLTDGQVQADQWHDGQVYYWPQEAQRAAVAPLRVRLIRVRSRQKKKDVWLLTNVLDTKRLPAKLASKFYRWRWENEGMFRTYKRTLSKLKLMSRKVRLVHREAEGSLLATQLLLALGASGMRPKTRLKVQANPEGCSPRKVLLAIRTELNACQALRVLLGYQKSLATAQRERRPRSSAKTRRTWPRRKDHKPPNPPKLLKLTEPQKARIDRLERLAA